MKSVLSIDQGTTGSTALVIAESGAVLGRAYSEFSQHFPQPGWVEHDAAEILRVTLAVVKEAVERSGAQPDGVGITNQRETVVAWDRTTGEPLHRALVWQDRRTADRCRTLAEQVGADYIASRTGLVWDPYFSGTKIEWLLENVPDLRARAEGGDAVFGTIDSWLVHRLTGGAAFVTDPTNASRTLLYNIHDRAWDPDLLGLLGVPAQSLPRVVPSSGEIGIVRGEHLGFEVPVAGIAGDQQAALFGQAAWEPGEAKCTYGTGAFLLMNLGSRAPTGTAAGGGILTTVGCGSRGEVAYAFEGSIFIAGAAVQWLRDGLEIVETAAATEAMAAGLADNGGVYFVPALTGLGAPHWEADARGTLFGLTRGSTRDHVVRAALESMAYGVKDVADVMTEVSGTALREMKVDGGAALNDWLMQFQADTLGVEVSRPDLVETTALGAAGLAGLAVGVWDSPGAFAGSREYRRFAPERDRSAEYDGWRRALDAVLHWTRSGRRRG